MKRRHRKYKCDLNILFASTQLFQAFFEFYNYTYPVINQHYYQCTGPKKSFSKIKKECPNRLNNSIKTSIFEFWWVQQDGDSIRTTHLNRMTGSMALSFLNFWMRVRRSLNALKFGQVHIYYFWANFSWSADLCHIKIRMIFTIVI